MNIVHSLFLSSADYRKIESFDIDQYLAYIVHDVTEKNGEYA